MLVRLFRGPFLNYNYKEGNSQLFYRNFHLLPQFHRNKHLKNTATFIATFWKGSREIRNFRPQLSQKRPAKSWGDWFIHELLLWTDRTAGDCNHILQVHSLD